MKKILIILLLWSSSASAKIPYTFTAGFLAKASEVNANFISLDNDIEDINSQISALESDGICNWWAKKHEVSYEAKTSTVGQSLSYNGNTYKIVAVPFREFGSGDLYSVKFPIKENTSGHIASSFSTSHVSNLSDCSQFTISGYPAYGKEVDERRTIFFYNNGSTESKSNIDFYYSVTIKVGETNLSIPLNTGETETNTMVSIGDYDFTDDFDTNDMTQNLSFLTTIDELLDYISIQRIQ